MDSDISVVELVRPMTSEYLQREVARRQSERGAEIEQLEAEIEAMSAEDLEKSDLPDRLEVLRGINGTHDAQEILADHTVKIALRSVTRREAFQRGQLQVQAREWLLEQADVEKYEDIDMTQVDDTIGEVWMAMYQAADIIPALIPEQCKGWKVPKTLEGWADVKDYIFTKALAETWALNPQFTIMQQSGEA